jgi:hypothetical protein
MSLSLDSSWNVNPRINEGLIFFSPFLQATKALRERRGMAILYF